MNVCVCMCGCVHNRFTKLSISKINFIIFDNIFHSFDECQLCKG